MASTLSCASTTLLLLLTLFLFSLFYNLTFNHDQLLTFTNKNKTIHTAITTATLPLMTSNVLNTIIYDTTPPKVYLHYSFLSTSSMHQNTTQISNHLFDAKKTIKKKKKKKNNRLERIECDLAKARVAIHQAIVSKSFKSDEKQSFVPRGSIYRNPYAFHQSHIEMVKRFKVWSYKEGERPIFHTGRMNGVYSIEGQFIEEIESEKSPFRAKHPEEAHTFFLPISVAHIIKFIYTPIIYPSDYNRDRLCRLMTDYVGVVANKYPFWNASHGADHFMLSCHDWAPEISHEKPKLFQYFIRVLCNANISEGFQPKRDVSLPEINLRSTLSPPDLGQVPQNRTILAFFVGRLHGYIRKILFQEWKDKDNDIQVHETLRRGQNYTKLMGKSKYCLCPSGYEVASPRVVEAINAGCVPVIICDSYSLPFSDVLDWSKFTIQIRPSKIPKLKSILSAIPNEKYLKLHNQVSQVKRHFVLNRPAQPFDVTHMVLHSIWLRRLNVKIGHLNS
ncbi:hypothetical protein G4B88_009905 [Cannabis sativa]|uniref:Exostosin GT47 domain-containing protein n=1 Tax=Cannabis sativa TaxID=3483 RepID=A0A7J6E0A1_CANSA|nr:hypothetical protein G4B88_009905 [Cannabis sativa]